MKRLLVALLPLLPVMAACSSSTPATSGSPDSGTVNPVDSGAAQDATQSPHDAGGGTKDAAGGSVDAGPGADSGYVVPADAGASGAAACQAWAGAFCAELSNCSSFGLGVAYGDVATCNTRLNLTCTESLAATGTGATPATTAACATSITQVASCTDFLAGKLGQACVTPAGSVAKGAGCAFDAQCTSGNFCAIVAGTGCGTCQTATTVGGACANGTCSSGQACDTVATPAKCVATNSVAQGGACDIQQQCDVAAGTGCNTQLGNTCSIPLKVSTPGGACGVVLVPTSVTLCPAAGTCSAQQNGTCSPAAADNAACSPDGGPACLAPASCVSGTCALPNASSCK